jgi:SAM-dependent methyltransferase
MDSSAPRRMPLLQSIWHWWRRESRSQGSLPATCALLRNFGEFARNSTPSRLRQRYGDADYDWDYRVNTTSAAVGWRDRLLGVFHSPYQPTDPDLFHEMMDQVHRIGLDYRDFTFVDLGSGKGRTLLMASDYPFRRIVGVELLSSLQEIARENLRRYQKDTQRCFAIDSICADAVNFALPNGPLLIYLFNPFPEDRLRKFMGNLKQNLSQNRRRVYLVYHNPLLEQTLMEGGILQRIGGTHQYSIYKAALGSEPEGV